jgi:hypothetical protein
MIEGMLEIDVEKRWDLSTVKTALDEYDLPDL